MFLIFETLLLLLDSYFETLISFSKVEMDLDGSLIYTGLSFGCDIIILDLYSLSLISSELSFSNGLIFLTCEYSTLPTSFCSSKILLISFLYLGVNPFSSNMLPLYKLLSKFYNSSAVSSFLSVILIFYYSAIVTPIFYIPD